MQRQMPGETQLAKPFAGLRQGWFYIIGLVALNLVRKLLLSKSSERLFHSSSRDRRTPARPSDRRSAALPSAYQPGSRPAIPPAHSGGEGCKRRPPPRTGNHDKPEADSALVCAAIACEMGPKWNFEGRRRWNWLHDGMKKNGWVEFGNDGVLRTSLCNGGLGQWVLWPNGEMKITFGKCHHVVFLLPQVEGQPPMFKMRERTMKDGSSLRGRPRGRVTRGCLEMEAQGEDASKFLAAAVAQCTNILC